MMIVSIDIYTFTFDKSTYNELKNYGLKVLPYELRLLLRLVLTVAIGHDIVDALLYFIFYAHIKRYFLFIIIKNGSISYMATFLIYNLW